MINEQERQVARDIVKRFGVGEGLFKGPRTLNAVEAIAQALSDARTRAPSDTEQRLREALESVRDCQNDGKCKQCAAIIRHAVGPAKQEQEK